MALQYGKCLGHAGVQVISGMARGIDGAGQRGALNGDGTTFAVLGCGVDVCYPRENIGLYMDIQKKRRNHIGISTRNRTTCKKFSDAEPDYQWTGGMDTGDRGKRKERIFDHCRFCTGSGEGCLCTSGTGDKCVESGMSQTDPAGSGNTDHTGRLMDEWNLNRMQIGQKNNKNEKMLESPERMVYSCLDLFPKGIDELMKETELSISD